MSVDEMSLDETSANHNHQMYFISVSKPNFINGLPTKRFYQHSLSHVFNFVTIYLAWN